MEHLEIAGIGKIKIRRGSNVKFLSIRMAPGRGVWINVPFGVGQRQAESFVLQKREWILQNLSQIKAYEQDTGVGLGIGAEVKTKLHVLKILETEASKPDYRMEGEIITLSVPKGTEYRQIDKIVQQFLIQIYTVECKQYLPNRVRYYADKYGFTFIRLSFRNNISNWGSCSHDNKISLNVKLMKLPDEIIDYIILHELCHTVEKNHSKNFWDLMQKVCPSYPALRSRLKKYNTRV